MKGQEIVNKGPARNEIFDPPPATETPDGRPVLVVTDEYEIVGNGGNGRQSKIEVVRKEKLCIPDIIGIQAIVDRS